MRFYRGVFGWEFEGPARYRASRPAATTWRAFETATWRGLIGAARAPLPAPGWNTYVRVTSADDPAAAVEAAGGAVEVPLFDADPAGRMAVVADPAGARLRCGRPAREERSS